MLKVIGMARNATNPSGLPAGGPYSHTVRAGNLVFLSGKFGTDKSGNLVGPGIAEQTRTAFANLKLVLDEAGLGMEDVVKCTVFITDLDDFAAINAVYAEHFTAPQPARSTVGVAALGLGAKVEIEIIAECYGRSGQERSAKALAGALTVGTPCHIRWKQMRFDSALSAWNRSTNHAP